MSTSTVNVGAAVVCIYGATASGPGSIQVINLDTENTVFVGTSSSINPANGSALPLGPLASQVMDGTESIWAVTSGPVIELGLVPGGGGYSPGSFTITGPVAATLTGPVTISDIEGGTVTLDNATVNVTGVGGYITPGQVGNIYNSVSTTAGPGTTVALASDLDVSNYTSVVLAAENVVNSSASAGAAVCAVFQLVWADSIGDETATDVVSLLLGDNANATWEIPVKGSFVTLQLQNVGTAGTITVAHGTVILDGAYRAIPNIRALQGFVGTPLPTLSGCTVALQPNPVFSVASWIASIQEAWSSAVGAMVFPLPQWAGQVTGYYQVITTALAKNATIVDLTYAVQGGVVSGAGYPYGTILNIPGGIDANPVPVSFNLPPTQCAVIISTPATAGEFFLSLVGVGN
jgi:hypothetical protein